MTSFYILLKKDQKTDKLLVQPTISILFIGTGTGYVQFGVFYSISCCARIVSWTFVPVNPGTITIFILRKTSEFKYRIVGSNCIDVSGKASLNTRAFHVESMIIICIS